MLIAGRGQTMHSGKNGHIGGGLAADYDRYRAPKAGGFQGFSLGPDQKI